MWGPLGMVMRARRSNNYFRACDVSEAERWGGKIQVKRVEIPIKLLSQ